MLYIMKSVARGAESIEYVVFNSEHRTQQTIVMDYDKHQAEVHDLVENFGLISVSPAEAFNKKMFGYAEVENVIGYRQTL